MNNRGSFQDLFFLIPLFFMVGIIIIMFYVMFSQINTQLQNNDNIAAEGKTIIGNAKAKYVGLFDNIFLVIFIFIMILILILASQVDINPIFFPISIVLYIALIFVSAVMANAFYNFMADPATQSYALEFTVIPFIFNNLVKILLGEAVLLGIVMYAKTR